MSVRRVAAPPYGAGIAREEHVGKVFLDILQLNPRSVPWSGRLRMSVGNQLPERRHGSSCGEPYQWLFRVPDGVTSLFAQVHPFYFLESTEMDPTLCFLAMRRVLTNDCSISSEACTYEFESGRASGMP